MQYVKSVSTPDMTISFKSSMYIMYLLETINPITVLDLGSGFTSFLCRLYKKNHPKVYVVSVDDDVAWLEQTTQFLKDNFLDISDCLTLDNLLHTTDNMEFEFVIYDLGDMETRIRYLPSLVRFVSKKRNLIFIDDLHKFGFLDAVKHFASMKAESFLQKKMHTIDKYGRYAGVIKNVVRDESY